MYSFTPTEEQQMLLDAVKRYAEGNIRPASREAEESMTELPPQLIEKGWELGILQASIPEAYEGFGDYSVLTGALAAEGLAYGDLSGHDGSYDTKSLCGANSPGWFGGTENNLYPTCN